MPESAAVRVTHASQSLWLGTVRHTHIAIGTLHRCSQILLVMSHSVCHEAPQGYRLREAVSARDFDSFARLAKDYHEWLDADLGSFQDFEEELESLPGTYATPKGCILLVSYCQSAANNSTADDKPPIGSDGIRDDSTDVYDVACVAIRPLIRHEGEEPDGSIDGPAEAAGVIRQAERGETPADASGPVCPLYDNAACALKRLWVDQKHQKAGLGKILVSAAIAAAKQRGFNRMVLDTLEQLTSANKLYERLRFERRTPFYNNPLPGQWVQHHLSCPRS